MTPTGAEGMDPSVAGTANSHRASGHAGHLSHKPVVVGDHGRRTVDTGRAKHVPPYSVIPQLDRPVLLSL